MEYFFVVTVERWKGSDLNHVTYTGYLKVAPRTVASVRYEEMINQITTMYGFSKEDIVVLFYSIEPKYCT